MFLKIKYQRLKLVLLLTKQQTKDPCEMGVTTATDCDALSMVLKLATSQT